MMDVSGVGFPSKVPWKKMSAEELENQYCPSRWVVRLGAEEALRTYSQIGIEDYLENNLPVVLTVLGAWSTCIPPWEASPKSFRS
ncbi:AFMID isoform 4 [Pan troglodytes]|uniref:Arylformamidase n=2 Tax=Pan troglodytes TaxID=9598 RepID=A0A2I3RAC9_PANTR|nr:AFMID isoform 4 [Pan troglodytes]